MKCKNAREALVLDLYGELSMEDQKRLEDHLRTCRTCAAERTETLRFAAFLEAHPPVPVPEPNRDRVWRGVEAALTGRPAPARRRISFGRQWSFAGAALVLVLVAGIFIGRSVFPPAGGPVAAAGPASAGAGMKPVLAGHLEDLKPLLLEFANASSEPGSDRKILVEESIVRALLLQNNLLRKALLSSNPEAADLLDDCDLILKEIINRNRPTSAAPADIQDLIRKRGVMFKLEILKKS
jgi:hypothetical protein